MGSVLLCFEIKKMRNSIADTYQMQMFFHSAYSDKHTFFLSLSYVWNDKFTLTMQSVCVYEKGD